MKLTPFAALLCVLACGCSTDNVVLLSKGEIQLHSAVDEPTRPTIVRSSREEVSYLSWDEGRIVIMLNNRRSVNHPEYDSVRPLALTVSVSASKPGRVISKISGDIKLRDGVQVSPVKMEILRSLCAPEWKPDDPLPLSSTDQIPVAVDTPEKRTEWLESQKGLSRIDPYNPTMVTCLRFKYDVPISPDTSFSLSVGKLSSPRDQSPVDLKIDFVPSIYRPSTH